MIFYLMNILNTNLIRVLLVLSKTFLKLVFSLILVECETKLFFNKN